VVRVEKTALLILPSQVPVHTVQQALHEVGPLPRSPGDEAKVGLRRDADGQLAFPADQNPTAPAKPSKGVELAPFLDGKGSKILIDEVAPDKGDVVVGLQGHCPQLRGDVLRNRLVDGAYNGVQKSVADLEGVACDGKFHGNPPALEISPPILHIFSDLSSTFFIFNDFDKCDGGQLLN